VVALLGMSFQATVYNVMVASPSDVEEGALAAVREALARWNAMHAQDKGVVLLLRSWRTHSSPELGDRPQAILNKQLIERSDLLIAVFWTRIGTATGEAESGTVEEIREHINQGKPVMIYFCEKPASPAGFDPQQIEKLKSFRSEVNGLYDTYATDEQLREKVERHLNEKLRDHPYFSPRRTDAALVIKKAAPRKPLSPQALELLREAYSDPAAQLMRMETVDGLFVATNGKNLHFRTPRDAAGAEAAIKELEKVGYFQVQGYKRHAFKVTRAGFEYFDQITKDLSSADHREFDNLLEVTNTEPRAAVKRGWEVVAKTVYRCAGKEPSNLDPNFPELVEAIGYLRKSARFSERLVREIESLRDSCRSLFTQSTFAGWPSKEEAIQFILRSAAAGRDLLSALGGSS
jgi:hypothetical protein